MDKIINKKVAESVFFDNIGEINKKRKELDDMMLRTIKDYLIAKLNLHKGDALYGRYGYDIVEIKLTQIDILLNCLCGVQSITFLGCDTSTGEPSRIYLYELIQVGDKEVNGKALSDTIFHIANG